LRSADRTLRLTGRAVSPTLGLLAAVRPVLPNLDTVLTDSVPIVSTLGAHSCDIKLFGKNWTGMMTYGNAGGGYLRLNLVGGIQCWPKGGEVVKAEFASADNVSPGKTPVRVHGVPVGEVEKVERRSGGRGVVVTMRLKDTHGFRVTRDARAHIYWRTLMGFNFYVELEPGAPSAPALGDRSIPLSHTTT